MTKTYIPGPAPNNIKIRIVRNVDPPLIPGLHLERIPKKGFISNQKKVTKERHMFKYIILFGNVFIKSSMRKEHFFLLGGLGLRG